MLPFTDFNKGLQCAFSKPLYHTCRIHENDAIGTLDYIIGTSGSGTVSAGATTATTAAAGAAV